MGMAVELSNVRKAFPDRDGEPVVVFDGLSLSCPAGSATILEGPSGSGKSTLLNLMAGLFVPDAGAVRVGDTPLHTLREVARDAFRAAHIGYVFQTFNLLSPLTALENLHVPAALAGNRTAASPERAREILVSLGLRDHLHKRPYELSVGQRQRVAVARALLVTPNVLLADEPTANLDAESARAVTDAFRGLLDEGTTLVVATHDPALKTAFEARTFHVSAKELR